MVFSSTIFLFLFLPFTLCGYYLIKPELRNIFLFLSSLLFYAFGEPKFVFIMIISILINYSMGIVIEISRGWHIYIRRFILVFTILMNLGILFYFKYFDFFISNINIIFKTNLLLKNIVLPIGISFFTFQGMSYVLDLYMDKVKVQNNPLNIALYISLFPQLVAGPIVRYKDVNNQIDKRTVDIDKFSDGVRRFIIGLAKKVCIANSVAIVADKAFEQSPSELTIGIAWIGIICYTMQIYFDFSGYSDMAIGLGKMFGFDFLENFNYPYISKCITEFWRRWHISLSSWFKDYVYIPLGGNRKGNIYFNLFIVFLVTGLWHGASWNFVIWGLWHGVFLIIERIFRVKKIQLNIITPLKWLYTMFIVIIGWVMFRADNIIHALNYVYSMFDFSKIYNSNYTLFYYIDFKGILGLLIGILGSVPIFINIKRNKLFNNILDLYYCFILFISIVFIVTSTYNPFIYFKF